MTIRVLVNGAAGKMGTAAIDAINNDTRLSLVARGGRDDDLAALLAQTQPDVAIDLTTAAQGYANAETIIAANVRPVIGTSGFLPEHSSKLQAQCANKKLGGLIVPNFSIGAVLMMHMSQLAARYYACCEIIEYHHHNKQDAPSGTAIATAEAIATARRQPTSVSTETHETEIIRGARGANCASIPIHAVRLPAMLAHQTVIFSGNHETLTIKHDCMHRSAFMPGLITAITAVMSLNKLEVGLDKVLFSTEAS